jgi:hypothetical protein
MNFCAQGYAKLTSRLQPHIAVLEGGYAIEGALPYVNVGIIMALAGMDYSKVKEPNYDPDKIRQSPDTTRYIERLVQDIREERKRALEQSKRLRSANEFAERDRSIFYDTDQILENQKEKLRLCPDCSGVLAIDSIADRGYHIYAVHIPRKACKQCQELGYQWFDTAQSRSYSRVFLQDRTQDQYLVRKA